MSSIIKNLFKKHPMLMNSLSYGTLCVGAEFSQQLMSTKKPEEKSSENSIDYASLARYGVIGYFINPNIFYFWYKWLDGKYTGKMTKTIVKKVLLDQFLITPPIYVIFYTSMSIMERKTDIFEELSTKFVPTFKTSCLFWLPAQSINFLLIPPTFRIVYIGSCSFVWLNILCWIKKKEL